MSEVQKILSKLGHQLTEEAENGYITKLHLSATEQAIYDLLMEKAIDYDLVTAIPVSAINALFGRTG